MNNIVIEKIWTDETFYEVRIKFVTEKVSAIHQTYINCGRLSKLSDKINEFIETKNTVSWSDSENFKESTLILELIKIDALGHVIIHIDIRDEDYRCQCNLNTCLGNIISFSHKLTDFDRYEVGEKITLASL